jgi:2-oxoglutarate dehydrogenase E1 component
MYRLSALQRAAKPLINKQALFNSRPCLRPTATIFNNYLPSSRRSLGTSPEANDSFLQGNAANYVEEMYEAWLKDPSSVHLSWQVYFKNMANGASPGQAYISPPTIMPSDSARLPELPGVGLPNMNESSKQVIEHMKIQLLVRAFQVRGHQLADLDPLGIEHASLGDSHPPELTYRYYGFQDKDLDRKFTLGPGILPALGKTEKELTLREIIDALKKMYCKLFIYILLFLY